MDGCNNTIQWVDGQFVQIWQPDCTYGIADHRQWQHEPTKGQRIQIPAIISVCSKRSEGTVMEILISSV